jgi:hypothetical protein
MPDQTATNLERMVAGELFLSASTVIYMRERWA